MATFEIKAGDTAPLENTLKDARGPVNLDGASVLFRMRPSSPTGLPAFEADAVVEQVTDPGTGVVTGKGNVHYAWGDGETDVEGLYEADWLVTFQDGKTRTFPSRGYDTVIISTRA